MESRLEAYVILHTQSHQIHNTQDHLLFMCHQIVFANKSESFMCVFGFIIHTSNAHAARRKPLHSASILNCFGKRGPK